MALQWRSCGWGVLTWGLIPSGERKLLARYCRNGRVEKTGTWNCPSLMGLPDSSFLTCPCIPHVKEILHFFWELTAAFHISNWNLCLIALTRQRINAAELLWGSEVVTGQTQSCPLTWLSPEACYAVPCGVAEMWPSTARGRGWTWPAIFSPVVRGSGYSTAEQISNGRTLMKPANPGQRVAELQVFGKSRVGRCLSTRVPRHGTAGTHHEPSLHGRARLGPTPTAARDANASDESKVN